MLGILISSGLAFAATVRFRLLIDESVIKPAGPARSRAIQIDSSLSEVPVQHWPILKSDEIGSR